VERQGGTCLARKREKEGEREGQGERGRDWEGGGSQHEGGGRERRPQATQVNAQGSGDAHLRLRPLVHKVHKRSKSQMSKKPCSAVL